MYAEVLVQYGSKSLDRTFTYKIPDNLIGKIKKGMKVSIPFGNQSINGFVLNVKETSDLDNIMITNLPLNNISKKKNSLLQNPKSTREKVVSKRNKQGKYYF